MYKNIFYFKKICNIGGTEQFLYEIAKKYHDYDITIMYDDADEQQLRRLRKYVRCKKRVVGERIECEKAFYNFNIDLIEQVDAKEHIFVSHAIYQILGYKPPISHPKLTRWIGVSQYSADKIEEYAKVLGLDIKAEVCYNPLTLEPKEKVVVIVSASRLDDKTKGGQLTLKLIDALDRCSERIGQHYMWIFFTNTDIKSQSKNIVAMQPRTDVRPYIASADYIAQLSKDMETYCYTINEGAGYGVPVITTPLTITKELGFTEDMQIILDWDGKNVDEVAEEILTRKKKEFSYTPPADNWMNLLAEGESTYKEELKMKYKVRALDTYQRHSCTDNELGYVPKEGEEFYVSRERLDVLLGANAKGRVYVEVVEEVEDVEPAEEITEEVVQAVAVGIVEEAKEQDKPVETIVEEIIEERKENLQEEEPKPKKTTSKNGGKTNGKRNQSKTK